MVLFKVLLKDRNSQFILPTILSKECVCLPFYSGEREGQLGFATDWQEGCISIIKEQSKLMLEEPSILTCIFCKSEPSRIE